MGLRITGVAGNPRLGVVCDSLESNKVGSALNAALFDGGTVS